MRGVCGEARDSDVVIDLNLDNKGTEIKVISKLDYMFGELIKSSVESVLREFDIEDVYVRVEDYGALDFVIRARTKTALKRALRGEKIDD